MCSGATASRPRRRTTSIRRCTSRGARSTRSAIEVREEVLQLAADVDVDRAGARGCRARRRGRPPRTARRSRSTAASCCRRTATTTGRRTGGTSWRSWPRSSRRSSRRSAPPTPPGCLRCLRTRARSSGASRELAELKALLGGTRLLTLAGTGGAGKTRLALELARAAEPSYPDGAALVEFAALADAALVPDAVAAALDVRALSGQTLIDAMVEFLAPRSLLLVVDNCEHLLAATAGLVDTLLRSAPQLTILATSREPLRVPGEVVFRVPSLDIPDPEQAARAAASSCATRPCGCSSSGRTAAAPEFALDEDNAVDVARICSRLDGLPLALELAAGRLGALGPAAIAERLDDRFRVLRTGSHASPTRQQTLAATLQWSHDLLGAGRAHAVSAACRVRWRLRARRGRGASAPAASSTLPAIADVLARLVEKSLVAADEGSSRERRYRLLETVRLYARERLDEAGETRRARRAARALGARAGRARSAARRGSTATPPTCVPRWTRCSSAPGDALRFCVALWPFWLRRIDLHEAQRRFDEALAAAPERTALRARGAARGGGDRLPQRRPAAGARARRGELRRRLGDRRCARRVAGASVPGRVRSRHRRGRRRDAVARARARARAA